MADIYGSHFEYNNKSSREYGLVIANVTTDRISSVVGNIDGITIFNKSANRRSLISDDKSDFPLSFDVEVITVDQKTLGYQERRVIEKWLFNSTDYHKLYMDIVDDFYCETNELIDGEIKRSYLNCRFINPQKLEYNGGVVGYKATLRADSGALWQDPMIKSFDLTNNSQSSLSFVQVITDTDLKDYIYPKITLHIGSVGGDVQIINHTDSDSRITKLIQLPPSSTVVMRGDINYVSGGYYAKFYKSNFVRLLDGANNLSVSGDIANITVEFQNRRSL